MTALRSVSASYDTQSFIPGQRDGSSGSVWRPRHGGERVVTHQARQPERAAAPAARRKRLVRRLWIPAVAVAVAVPASVVGALVLLGPGAEAPRKQGAAPSKAAFQPWDVELSARGSKAAGMAQCTYAARTLYCTSPGVLAAAVDPVDGKVLWSRGDTERHNDGTVRPPVLSGGLLHVVSRGGKRLAALDPATGRTRWSHDIAAYGGRVAQAGGVVLLAGADARVTALDAATGKEKWRHRIPGQPQPTFLSYGDGLAYAVATAGSGTQVAAVDPKTGATRWQRRFDGALSLVGAHDGAVWFTSTTPDSDTDAVVRYEVASRTVRRVGLRCPLQGAQAVVRKDTVYLLANGGALVTVDTRTAKELRRLESSVSFASAPVVAGDRVYFAGADGRLLAVDASQGVLLGQTKARLGGAHGSLASGLPTPVAADGKVYSAAPDGSLFAVDARRPAGW